MVARFLFLGAGGLSTVLATPHIYRFVMRRYEQADLRGDDSPGLDWTFRFLVLETAAFVAGVLILAALLALCIIFSHAS